jgi:DNA-binding transcriptional LysR family regulator
LPKPQGNNFSAAARALSLTPAAISKNIKRLEEDLGIRMFHRNTRSMSLTPEGRLVFEKYAMALEYIEEAHRLASARSVEQQRAGRFNF